MIGMKQCLFHRHRHTIPFLSNQDAVLGLPMRLTVALIIGSVALAAILGFILQPCIFPQKMIIAVDPMVYDIVVGNPFTVTVQVRDSNGQAVSNALVIIKGLGDAVSGSTSSFGTIDLDVSPTLDGYEGYLDVQVKAPCFETFDQTNMIKVIDTTPTP